MPDNGPYVIRVIALADGSPGPEGLYVQSYTPDGHHGRGDLVLTEELADAKRYADAAAAMAEWQATSSTHPIRPGDGKPNRPMTAFTVEVHRVEPDPGPGTPPPWFMHRSDD